MSTSIRRLVPAAEVAEAALAAAAGELIVIVEDSSEAEVRFANNTTTTNGTRRNRRVSVVAFDPGRQTSDDGPGPGNAQPGERHGEGPGDRAGDGAGVAVATVSRSGPVEIAELVAQAEHEARGAPPAEDAEPLLGPGKAPAPDASFGDDPAYTDLAAFGELLGELADLFERARREHRVLAGFGHHVVTTTYLASSTGLRLRHVQPSGTLELVARSEDGSASTWAGVATPDFAGVSLDAMERRLAERLSWASRRIDLPAGRYETLLPPDAVADLTVMLYEATGGRDAEDGRSVFSAPGGATKVGEQLTSLPFRLRSDPAAPGFACMPFLATSASGADVSVFDNGLSLGATDWIEGGRLARLQYHRAGAARAGVPVAPPIDNLLLELPGATASLEEMIARTERALLVTCLWYVREVDPATLLLTGLTRDGVYLVEHGEVVGAVNNFRWNESPVDALARTLEAGAMKPAFSREWNEWLPRVGMPALRIADFNMSSVSPAS
jgi:predicted Zn-dependent protease